MLLVVPQQHDVLLLRVFEQAGVRKEGLVSGFVFFFGLHSLPTAVLWGIGGRSDVHAKLDSWTAVVTQRCA